MATLGEVRRLNKLLREVRACTHCAEQLPLGPRPVVRGHASARVLIVGQAPGTRVHETGIPWNDPSGDRLRAWMKVDRKAFYDERRFAIIPMGFCYPGRGKSGDLPPRRECSELWLDQLLEGLPDIEFTIVLGQYAQAHYLGERRKKSLTETVRAWRDYWPEFFPMPHPSPRNIHWLQKNAWFESKAVPALRRRLKKLGVV